MSFQEGASSARENREGDLRKAVADGLLYAHSRLNANTSKTLEARRSSTR